MQHSRLAPSSAARRVACPGSRALEERYPEETESAAAREGTAAHWLAQRYLMGKEDKRDFAPNGEMITDEMEDGAELYERSIRSIVGDTARLHVEERVNIFGVHPDCWGTPDCWALVDNHLHVFDYKFGFGYVDVFENWQLLEYALGIAHDCDFEKVTMTIIQPRCFTREGKVRSWTISRDKLFGYYLPMLQISESETMNNDADCVPNPQCLHCKGRHACDALQKTVAWGFDVIADHVSTELNATQTGVELRYLHRMSKLLEARITGLEEQARSMIMRGESVTGYKLEPGSGRDQWTCSAEEIITLGELLGLDLSKPQEAITPAQARKLGIDDSVLAGYVERISGKLKLVESNAQKIFGGGY